MQPLFITPKVRKSILSFLLALVSIPSFLYANMPVIDINAIAQSILQYNQTIQEAIKYEKELQKMGIDTGRVGGILGQLDGLTNSMITSLEAAQNLPLGIKQIFSQLSDRCDFLKKDEKFKNEIAKEKSTIENIAAEIREQTACLRVMNNTKFMAEATANAIQEAQEALKKIDFDTYNSQMNYIKNLYDTKENAIKEITLGKVANYEKIYTYYSSGEGAANGISKKEMESRYKHLLSQAKQANTQTDAQNLGNQLLVEIINMLRMHYDMMIEYNSAMLSLQSEEAVIAQAQAVPMSDEDIKEQKERVGVFAPDSPFEKYKGEYKKDALGLPIIGVSSK